MWTGNRANGGGGIASIKSIQNGVHSPMVGQQIYDQPINAVDINKSVAFMQGFTPYNGSAYDFEDLQYDCYLTSGTNVRFERSAEGNAMFYHAGYTVLEFENVKNKYTGTFVPAATTNIQYHTIPNVDMDKCLLFWHWKSNVGIEEVYHQPGVWLDTATRLGFRCNVFQNQITIRYTILEFE